MPFCFRPCHDAPDALGKAIDKMTMEIGHGRQHKAYVDNLDKPLEDMLTSRRNQSTT